MKSNEAIATVAQILVTEWLSNGWANRSPVSDIRVDDITIVPHVSASKRIELAEAFWSMRGNMVQDIYHLGLSDAITEAASKLIAIKAENLARKMADSIENTVDSIQYDLRTSTLANICHENPCGSEAPSFTTDIDDGLVFEYSASSKVVEFLVNTHGFATELNLTLYALFQPAYTAPCFDFTSAPVKEVDLIH